MRNQNEIDKILKDKLGQYDSGAPMHLFDRIEEGLVETPERKKRGGLWWTLGLLLMLVGATTSWYFITDASTEKSSIENNNEITEVENNIKVAENALTILSSKSLSQTELQAIPSTVTTKNTTTPVAISKKSNNKNLTSKQASATESKISESKTIIKNHQFINEEQLVPNTTQHPTLFSKGKISTDSPLTMAASTERKPILTARKLDEAFGQKVPALVDLNIKYNSEFQLPDIKCGDKKDRMNLNFTTSMDLFVSPERSFRFLEYKSDDFAEHAIERNETEKAYYSFSSGLRLNFLANNGFAVRTGLVYSQINEIFEDQFLVTELVTNPISGDTIGFSQYLNDVTTFNRYKMIDVPFMVGYEMEMKRSTINVNAGVFVNVKATQKGTLLDEEGTKRNFTTGVGDYQVFRKNIGVSYFMSLGAAYELSPQYQFFFEPHLRYYPGSFAKQGYVLNQKYVTGGIMLGIRKQL